MAPIRPFEAMRRHPSATPEEPPLEDPEGRKPRLRKALGQHHLRSGGTCRPLLDFLRPAGRFVVEIGPGGGVLTAELVAAGARVLALELDRDWAAELRRRQASRDLEVRVADALEFDWSALPAGTLVAGNLPYNVGTAIVERVLRAHPPIDRAGFLLQREVVDRLVAEPGDGAYGALSVLVRLRAGAAMLGKVRPGAFTPPPRVDSAFVGLELKSLPAELGGTRADQFENWLREAFGKRRKTLANSLANRNEREAVVAALAGIHRPAATRAEALSLSELSQIFARLEPSARASAESSRLAIAGRAEAGGTISGQGTERKH